MRLISMAPLTASLALVTACASVVFPEPEGLPLPGARVRNVVVISIDGLRPDAIEPSGAETLQQLMATGAYSLRARTIFPSKTLPSHTSMLTGVSPEKHGVTWNEERVEEFGRVQVPTVFDLTDSAGLSTAAFFGKPKFRHLFDTKTMDFWATAPAGSEVLTAPRMAEDVKRYLKYRRPNLLFVHIADPDLAGHAVGWMSLPYRVAVRRADLAVGHIWRTATERFGDDFVLIVTADHGGHDRTHGTDMPVDMTIPWIVWGQGVQQGEIGPQITTYDTAATVLWLLGIPRPENWDGEPVATAFTFAVDSLPPAGADSLIPAIRIPAATP